MEVLQNMNTNENRFAIYDAEEEENNEQEESFYDENVDKSAFLAMVYANMAKATSGNH